jgi:chemotaxis protein histidine kinase CheA
MRKLSEGHPERGPAAGFLNRWGNLVTTLAERRGKKCGFVSDVDEEKIPGDYLELSRDVVPQLLRNAVIHGIETPAERESLGKQASGTIQFSRQDYPDWIEFVVQDDGRGLDHAAVIKQAALAGISGEVELREVVQDLVRHALQTRRSQAS